MNIVEPAVIYLADHWAITFGFGLSLFLLLKFAPLAARRHFQDRPTIPATNDPWA